MRDLTNKVKITTGIDRDNGVISLVEEVQPFNKDRPDFASIIVDTRERAIRDGLIEMGWTPPVEDIIKFPAITEVAVTLSELPTRQCTVIRWCDRSHASRREYLKEADAVLNRLIELGWSKSNEQS